LVSDSVVDSYSCEACALKNGCRIPLLNIEKSIMIDLRIDLPVFVAEWAKLYAFERPNESGNRRAAPDAC